MKRFHTRRLLCAGLLGAAVAGTLPAWAQSWPSKPLRLIVPAGPGSAPDIIARLLADKLGQGLGQTVFVDNKPGAGGIPGMSALARAANDGYTLGFVPAAMGTVTPLVYKTPQFNPDTELSSVATVGTSPLMIVAPASSGITSLAELSRYSQGNAGRVNFAAPQLNSLPHLAGEMVSKMGHMGLFTVPYPAPPAAITAVLSGDALVTADGIPGVIQHIKAGRLRALAVTSAKRVPGFDDVPAVAETYAGFEAAGWFQLMVPSGTAPATVERLNREVNRAVQLPDLVGRLAELGVFPRPDNVAQARDYFAEQQRLMKKFVTDLGIQPQ